MLIFDIETNGLLDTLDTIHCIAALDLETGARYRCSPAGKAVRGNVGETLLSIEEGVRLIAEAGAIAGHNVIGFDIPAIRKVYPWFNPKGGVRDTLLISALIFTDLAERDARFRKKNPQFPGNLTGSHSLEAWGIRLGEWKGDYAEQWRKAHPGAKAGAEWTEWSQEMDDYCQQDVSVTAKLWEKLVGKKFSEESIELEHAVAPIIVRQMHHGFMFDEAAASKLAERLKVRKIELEAELQQAFPAWYRRTGLKTHGRNASVWVEDEYNGGVTTARPKTKDKPKRIETGYFETARKGVQYSAVEETLFNPSSRDHIADRLISKYGWKPALFTPCGKPQVDEDVLGALKYPEANLLSEYLLVCKRVGQVDDGKQAWNKVVKRGRIYGRVVQNGAVTGRMTHSRPNVAQTPAVGVPYGVECRSLFIVPKGKKLVGADASGLELRCLAHFMARWDNGAYAKVILEGDIHAVNGAALFGMSVDAFLAGRKDHTPLLDVANSHVGSGEYLQSLAPGARKSAKVHDYYDYLRNVAKTFIYAFLYGAGDAKIGSIIGKGAKAGKQLKERFLQELPALGSLVKAVKKAAKEKGYLRGLDGRLLHVRSDHAALNTLLQSAGALVMKKALVILDNRLQELGFKPAAQQVVPDELVYEFVANIHDEWQNECDEEIADTVGIEATRAITAAGEHFGFRCPLAGEFKIGRNWAETH